MSYHQSLEVAANVAAILTALGAGWAYGSYRWALWIKRKRLERYLKRARKTKFVKRGTIRLMSDLGLTESEVLQASFRSRRTRRSVAVDPETGRANAILFEYEPPEF